MRLKKFIKLVATAAFSVIYVTAFGQDTTNTIGNVAIASPTAASLGKYGDIPVCFNTGIPNVSIPIYTAKAGAISLPIGLSYHASGLRVQEQASWVGAGWSLNSGGVITRTVVGAPDDRGVQSSNVTTNGYYSDSGYNSYLFLYRPGNQDDSWDGYWPDDVTFCQGFKDGEPDLFFFNFGGYTGKFYFNDDQTPVFVPEADFRVQVNLNNGIGGFGFQGFVITTPNGVKYYFGMSGNDNPSVPPIETTSAATVQNNYLTANQAVSAWYLNKVISADGMDSINLFYQPENYSCYTMSMFPISNVTTDGGILAPSSAYTGFNLVKDFIQGVRLSQITFPNGSITFNPAASPRTDLAGGYTTNTGIYDATNNGTYPAYALGSISIANTSGFCKKDSFYYAYFYDNNALTLNAATYGSYNLHSDAYRLRLDSVLEFSCDGSAKVPHYAFTYYSELVPRKLSFGIDDWGFSNGVTNNQVLIPTYAYATATGSTVLVVPGANRDAAWPAMRGGALQQITYPTGGFTQFTYQPNDTYVNYTKYVPTPRLSMSCGYDGHNGTLGDGGDNPDTATFISAGGTLVFTMANSSQGGNAQLEIFYSGTNTLAYNVGTATTGQTDTFYTVLSPGTYWAELTKSQATSGYGVTATITENIGVGVSGNDTVGGLRIGTLTNNDGMSPNSVVTNYTYTTGGTQSSGILYSRPVYVQSIRNDVWGWVYGPNDGSSGGCDLTSATYYMSPTSIAPMQEIQGNHIGYNQVQVSQTGNGYTIYRYYGSNYWDNKISDVCSRTINTWQACTPANIPNFPAAPLPFDPMRGELKYEGQFNQAGQVLKDVTYTPVYVFDSLETPAVKYISQPFYSNTSYSLQSARKVQTTTVATLYDPSSGGSVTSTSKVYYGSIFHNQPTRQVATTSTGDSLATNTQYILDFRVTSCDAIPDSMPYFYTATNADTTEFFRGDSVCAPSDWLCRMDTFNNMRRHVNLLRQQFVRYRRRSFDGPTSIQGACYALAEAAADTALKPILRLQDEFDNVPVERSQWRDNKLLQASFSKYDTSLNPVGFAYPDRTQLINLQAPSSSFTPSVVSSHTIAKDSRYLDETLYQISNGKPQQVTPHNGMITTYVWDYLNQEPIAKVTGATVGQIAYTSFESNGSGSWTIPSGTRDNSTAITGGSSYNLSNGVVSRTGLGSSTTYVVSYWSKTGSPYTVSGNTGYVQGKTISINNGTWTYFEHTVTGVSTVTVSGAGDIDELRLYPSGSLMSTYTYTPLLGMTSECDINNRVSYYTYDGLGRLKYIRDQDGNIVKTIDYHYQGQ